MITAIKCSHKVGPTKMELVARLIIGVIVSVALSFSHPRNVWVMKSHLALQNKIQTISTGRNEVVKRIPYFSVKHWEGGTQDPGQVCSDKG